MDSKTRLDIIEILSQDARRSAAMVAAMIGCSEEEAAKEIADLEKEQIIMKYSAIINEERIEDPRNVHALIEVKVVPQFRHGYEMIAQNICVYDEVRACYLMSGTYDFMVLVDGRSVRDVARFVAEKLSVIEGVTSTATHFVLRKYKDNHVIMPVDNGDQRQVVTP